MKEEKILCPYCSTPLTKEAMEVYNGTYGCETGCDYYNVEVDCPSCGKEIYNKGNFGSFDDDKEKMEITEEEWEEMIKNNPSLRGLTTP